MRPLIHDPAEQHCSLNPEASHTQCVGGNTVQLATEVSVHAPGPPQGVARVRWDKDILASQTFPNPDDAGPNESPGLGRLRHSLGSNSVCSDASSATMKCLRSLRHLGGPILYIFIHP